jgi:hypothetical protein
VNDPQELYAVYAKWTGQLHAWMAKLGHYIDCEYFPDSYQFKLYSGAARALPTRFTEDLMPLSTVPNLRRPQGERSVTVQLPLPQDDPSQETLDRAFRDLCLAAARVLELDLKNPALGDTPVKKHALLEPRPKRRRLPPK